MIVTADRFEVATPHGPAVVELEEPGYRGGLLVLGHGAGGGIDAPDLRAAASAGSTPLVVARVLQPYRAAGRRPPPPAAQLDEAWACVLAELTRRFPDLDQVHGGRSSGGRVACRGAVTAEKPPVGVIALAFPMLAPARKDGTRADRSPEIDAVADAGIPTLVVQGERDAFGIPPTARDREVVTVKGDHSLRAQGPVREAVAPWLARFFPPLPPGPVLRGGGLTAPVSPPG